MNYNDDDDDNQQPEKDYGDPGYAEKYADDMDYDEYRAAKIAEGPDDSDDDRARGGNDDNQPDTRDYDNYGIEDYGDE